MYRSLGVASRGRLGRWGSRLGDDGDGYIYETGPNAGQPVTDNPLQVTTDIPPSFSDIFGTAAPTVSFSPSSLSPVTLPGVTPSTLLAAAALPNAPAVVKQAAATYSAANPLTSWFSGSMISGIPNYLLAGVGLFAVVIVATGGKKRR